MKIQKYIVGAVMAVAAVVSCSPDPDLYPLPYDSRATGSYLRVYRNLSNVWEFNELGNNKNAFRAVYESVDKAFGADLKEIQFYATFRSGSSITDEVLVKTIAQAEIDARFNAVSEPTYSDYLRSDVIEVTEAETLTALLTLNSDPDGQNGVDAQCTGIFPKTCPAVAFPGVAGIVNGDRIVFRVAIKDKQDRLFTVANQQTAAAPYLGNPNEANITPNLTNGIFYSSPMMYTMTYARSTNPYNANSYTGNWKMTQIARWQGDHSPAQHRDFPQAWIDQILFGNSTTDSTQSVALSTVTNGLPTERTFTCTYRGESISMVINLENTPQGLTPEALLTLNQAVHAPGMAATTPFGMGFPLGSTAANLGTVFVPIANTGVDCSSTREFYQVTPLGGQFAGLTALPWGLPRNFVPNRGAFRNDRDGSITGDRFSIVVSDDADEYGRFNGYCNWTTNIVLLMEKIP
jgi:hypothetical protein